MTEPLCGSQTEVAGLCSVDGWCFLNPLPFGGDATAVWSAARDDIWVAGGMGTLRRWNGASWSEAGYIARDEISTLWGSGAGDIWLFGVSGGQSHWDGATFTQVREPGPLTGTDWYPYEWQGFSSGPTSAWAAWRIANGDEVGGWLTWDGTRWTPWPDGPASGAAFFGSSPTDVWAATWSDGLWHFDGTRFTEVATSLPKPHFVSSWGTGADDVWAAGGWYGIDTSGGFVGHWDGRRWSDTKVPSGFVFAVTGAGSRVLALAGSAGPRSGWGVWEHRGDEWESVLSCDRSSPCDVAAIRATAEDDAWAVGRHLYRSRGGSFERFGCGPVSDLDTLVAVGDDEVMAFGGFSGAPQQILHARAGRIGRFSETPTWIDGAFAAGPDRLWILGDGRLRQFDGSTWSSQGPGDVAFHRVAGSSASDVWAAGKRGETSVLFHYDGASWSEVAGPRAGIDALWESRNGDAWAVDIEDAIWRFDAGRWVLAANLPPRRANWAASIWGQSAGDAWFMNGSDRALHWDGRAFVEVPLPDTLGALAIWGAAPDDAWLAGSELRHWDGQALSDPISISTNLRLSGISGTATNDVWAVSDDGQVLHFDGARWTIEQSHAGARIHAIVATRGAVHLAGEAGILLRKAR